MKIDPCPCVVSLKDGSNHTLFQFRDFLGLVDQAMGMDAAKWLEAHVNRLMEVLQGNRINREKITHSVREIGRIIQNQI